MIRRVMPLAALALVAAATLAGCTGDDAEPTATQSPAPSETVTVPTETATPTTPPTPTPSATATDAAAPACTQIVSAGALYSYNPNYALVTDSPGMGARGCVWTADSSSSTITLDVSAGGGSTGSGTAVPGYTGTFAEKSGVGTATVAIGDWHVVAASAVFGTVDDATAFLDLITLP